MRILLFLLLIGGILFWYITRPEQQLPYLLPEGNKARGEYIATASGCASCHGENYQGGDALYSPFGTFYAPNITPAYYNATPEEFTRAMINGVGRNGKHLYPAFPYSTYQGMSAQDMADLYLYISALPAVDTPSRAHDLPFYAKWRRGLGVWKALRTAPPTPETRGAYLVEVLGHCQECHTPRSYLGTLRYDHAFEGGDIYGEKGKLGKASNLISGDASNWSVSELASYFKDGFTPDYDSVGGEMVDVVENLSRLTEEDRVAIAEYIAALSE